MAEKENPKPRAKRKNLTPKQERFAAEVIKNGGNATKAMIAAGYSEKGARVEGHRLLTNPNIQERIQRAREHAGVTPEIVSGILAQHLLGDLADVLDDAGRFNYEQAKARGVTSQIKKLKIKEREMFDSEGDKAGVETTYELELYSAQEAAKIFVGTLGMQKQPGVNPQDAARVREEIDRLITEGWSEADAQAIVLEAEPQASQWIQ